MKLDHLESLTEDELAMLWFCINKINPPVLSMKNLNRVYLFQLNING